MKQLVEKLTQTFGPSGYEKQIREVILDIVEPYADECRVDAMGSLIVKIGNKAENGKRVMISAHMDEIGLMASHIDENGFVYVAALGGINPLNCVAARVRFENGVEGVIGVEKEKMDKVPTLAQLFVDVGAKTKEECPVKVGDVAVFERPFLDLGERWVSKTMDNRIGCAIAIETLKNIKNSPNELYFVFSVQEEVGCRGALTAAYSIDPDMGIAVDVTVSADTPYGDHCNTVLGNGPCIKARDALLVANPKVIAATQAAAERVGVPYQMEVLRFAGTDAGNIQLIRSGVPSGAVSVACRYVHSPSEMVDVNDVKNSVKLLSELLSSEIKL